MAPDSNMKRLSLDNNHLTQLPAYLFNYTPKIEYADFSSNKIETIDPNTFAVGVDNLRIIDLSTNQIKTIDGRTFANVISLINLRLEYNQINYIGLRIVKFDETQSLDSYSTSSLNCLIFRLKNSKFLFVYVNYFVAKNHYRSRRAEIDCDTDHSYWLPNRRSSEIDGVEVMTS